MELIERMRELEAFIAFHKELRVCDVRNVAHEVARGYPSLDFAITGKAQVMADDAIFSVIDNVVQNAVVHGKADRIEIAIRHEGDLCEMQIVDNGSGVEASIKESVFEKGFIHGTSGHTGLGLNIVKKTMERYGGSVSIRDNEPHGAVFILTFRMVG
jgi:signal transduction histidine kinase